MITRVPSLMALVLTQVLTGCAAAVPAVQPTTVGPPESQGVSSPAHNVRTLRLGVEIRSQISGTQRDTLSRRAAP
jgi:hypothetical protein